MKDLSREVPMMCPLCGNNQFEFPDNYSPDMDDSEEAVIRCIDCGSKFTREELIAENAEIIDNAMEELKKDAQKEIEKEIARMFRKWK